VPKLKSSKKRLRISLKAQMRNKAIRTRMRSAIKKVRTAADKSTAEASLSQAISIVDSTVRKGKLHRNTAARYKSRLSHFVKNMD
jgi:small subunit ribosomal protein S20